jgi:hypothetical protein
MYCVCYVLVYYFSNETHSELYSYICVTVPKVFLYNRHKLKITIMVCSLYSMITSYDIYIYGRI